MTEATALITATDLPALPIIREALKANGISVADALADTSWQHKRSPLTTSATRMDVPFILFDADGGTIDWGQPKVEFKFSKQSGTYRFVVTIMSVPLPESALSGLSGQKLTRLVSLPGSDKYVISEALNENGQIRAVVTLAMQ